MLNISLQEILIILVIALLVVGPEKLPDLARSIGKGLREIRRAQDEVKRTIQVNLDDEPPNGGRRSPAGRADGAPTSSSRAENAPTPTVSEPTRTAPEPVPIASEPLPASEMREISRTLGRGLAEIRRAREEVQRSFRIDLNRPSHRPAPSPAPRAVPIPSLDEPPALDEPTTANDAPPPAGEVEETEAPEGRTAG